MQLKIIFLCCILTIVFLRIGYTQSQIGQDIFGQIEDQFHGYDVSITNAGNYILVSDESTHSNHGVTIYKWSDQLWSQVGDKLYYSSLGFTESGDKPRITLSGDGKTLVCCGEVVSGSGSELVCQLIPVLLSGFSTETESVQMDDYKRISTNNTFSVQIDSMGNRIVLAYPSVHDGHKYVMFARDQEGWTATIIDQGRHIYGDGRLIDISNDGQTITSLIKSLSSVGPYGGDLINVYEMDTLTNTVDKSFSTQVNGDIIYELSISGDGSTIAAKNYSHVPDLDINIAFITIIEYEDGEWVQRLDEQIEDLPVVGNQHNRLSLSYDGDILACAVSYYLTTSLNAVDSLAFAINIYSNNEEGLSRLGQIIALDQSATRNTLDLTDSGRYLIAGAYYWASSTNFGRAKVFDLQNILLSTEQVVDTGDQYTIGPVPCIDQFTVSSHDRTSFKIHLYNIAGQQVYSEEVGTGRSTIDVTRLAEGNYVLVINAGSKTYRRLVQVGH